MHSISHFLASPATPGGLVSGFRAPGRGEPLPLPAGPAAVRSGICQTH